MTHDQSEQNGTISLHQCREVKQSFLTTLDVSNALYRPSECGQVESFLRLLCQLLGYCQRGGGSGGGGVAYVQHVSADMPSTAVEYKVAKQRAVRRYTHSYYSRRSPRQKQDQRNDSTSTLDISGLLRKTALLQFTRMKKIGLSTLYNIYCMHIIIYCMYIVHVVYG